MCDERKLQKFDDENWMVKCSMEATSTWTQGCFLVSLRCFTCWSNFWCNQRWLWMFWRLKSSRECIEFGVSFCWPNVFIPSKQKWDHEWVTLSLNLTLMSLFSMFDWIQNCTAWHHSNFFLSFHQECNSFEFWLLVVFALNALFVLVKIIWRDFHIGNVLNFWSFLNGSEQFSTSPDRGQTSPFVSFVISSHAFRPFKKMPRTFQFSCLDKPQTLFIVWDWDTLQNGANDANNRHQEIVNS